MLTKEQQRELLAVGLLALGLFVALALVPVSLLGESGARRFPSGNLMGVVGGAVNAALSSAFGLAAACVPVLLLLGGLHAFRWVAVFPAVRVGVFVAGLLVLLPAALYVAGGDAGLHGLTGRASGRPLVLGFGWLGAAFVLGVAFALLCVGALAWNPLRAAGRALLRAARLVGAAASRLADAVVRAARSGRPPDSREPEPARTSLAAAAVGAGASLAGAPASGGARLGAGPGAGSREGRGGAGAAAAPAREPAAGAEGARSAGGDSRDVPPVDLFTPPPECDLGNLQRELDRLGDVLIEKLRTFNVEGHIAGRTTGPVVTQFEVIPAPGVKVNRIAALDADLALAMKAPSVRIVAPIPGKGAVGVEVPNPEPEIVYLREILESEAYRAARAELPLVLGKDLTGDPYLADLARMPHLLIAGATGSGKSVCLNTMITSLVCRHTPRTLRLILIDPKMVELSTYGDLPHLRHPVVTDPRDAAIALKWAVFEMERRYELLSVNGLRSVAEFNRRVRRGVPLRRPRPEGPEGDPDRWVYTDGLIPYIVVVVDELADFMMTVQAEIERPLAHLAQKARAIGLHLIVATQRPSVNVITGLIKANFPCRIAFRVSSKVDSRTILDQNGADALLGNGDMLFLPPGQSEPVRIQGAYTSTEDTDRLMLWFRKRAEERALEEGARRPPAEGDILEIVRLQEEQEAMEGASADAALGERDELFRAAAEICIQHQQGSTSLLQRRLRIGYGRAARIVDQLHQAGILGPPDGSKPREVLVGLDELDAICGEGLEG
ncbi:MAG: hypothetical protein HY704_02370 [Gemmatimonadetes bacterium]|nr:hypothetical protein [Gemmatimonadota bacterium]